MKKNRLLAIALCFSFTLTAQEVLPLEYDSGEVHFLTLTNGFCVFVKEDHSSALIHTEFICRAGYSSQTAANAGFFPLYAQIF